MIKKIVVIGSGTSGLLTALYCNKMYPDFDVMIIENSKQGILGAGEGTTPHIISFLDDIGIPVSDLIKNTESTIKNNILFSGWNLENKKYYHSFVDYEKYYEDKDFYSFIYKNEIDIDSFFLPSILSDKNKVPFSFNKLSNSNRILDFKNIANWSIHFNANELALFLKNIAKKRNILFTDDIVIDFECDENGLIKKILCDSGGVVDCDFIFDCSGFSRKVIGSFYSSKWTSVSDTLPSNRAVPFFLEMGNKIPTYTESKAMSFGWMWKIPLQTRYGCGYVFDSSQISDEEAVLEIEKITKKEITLGKVFSFDAGYFETPWIKNCVAIGLSSSFLEPLEATSIMQQVISLKRFFSLENPFSLDKNKIKKFNLSFVKNIKDTIDFIYLHYVTNKKNTKFWSDFTKNNYVPEKIKEILDINKNRNIIESDINNSIFTYCSFVTIMIGNKIIKFHETKNNNDDYFKILNNIKKDSLSAIDHNQFINYLGEKNDRSY